MKLTVDKLTELRNQGYSDKEIADMYNMHPDSVRKKRAKNKIPKADKRLKLEREWPEIRELNSQGYNDREIAEMIPGISQAGVQKIRVRLGIAKADYGERLDKKYICKRCGKEVTIKRKEHRQKYCQDCKSTKIR
jgi:DNA-directed RNA polymerase subunit RPC12/RpoP